jgi:hypothetical protein
MYYNYLVILIFNSIKDCQIMAKIHLDQKSQIDAVHTIVLSVAPYMNWYEVKCQGGWWKDRWNLY